MELKEKLVALRKEKGLTQSAVAEKLDVSRQAISRWESGIALPSTDNLKSLSALYGVPVDGGRDQTSLWNTEGCVRIFDKDAKKITGLMDSWRSAGYHQFGRIKITRPGQSL